MAFFRAASFKPQSFELGLIRVFLFCGRLDLDIADSVQPGQDREVVLINITALAGKVHLLVRPDIDVFNHKAFLLRFRHGIQSGVLDDKTLEENDVVASTLAFFGDTMVTVAETQDLTSGVPGTLPGHFHRPAATP
jgi:hypothetical protein